MERVGPRRLAVLLRELHFAAQYVPGEPGPARGLLFERLIADRLAAHGFPVQAVSPGVRIVGALPVSGIGHQFDAEIRCSEAEVIGEWKAYAGSVPKSELMVFKEKSEDVYMSIVGRRRRQPLFRVFGMAGDAQEKLRLYAARYGISLVERSRWPAAVLADVKLSWPTSYAPVGYELRALRFLARPLHRVYGQTPGGRLVAPRPLERRTGELLLSTHDAVSARLDDLMGCDRELGEAA